MTSIQAVFFDLAHTLLDKPDLYPSMQAALNRAGALLPIPVIRSHHRLLMEVIEFPDYTSREFYADFNSHLLRSLGLLPTEELLDDLYSSCSYLPWSAFADTNHLREIKLPIGILSNWDKTLVDKLALLEGAEFRWVMGSAETGLRKPDPEFFAKVFGMSGLMPKQVAYVGDSIRLDIEPAHRLGMRAVLVDRYSCFPYSNIPRISHLSELMSAL